MIRELSRTPCALNCPEKPFNKLKLRCTVDQILTDIAIMNRINSGPARALIILLVLGSTATAAEAKSKPKESQTLPTFNVIDTDRNRILTLPEIEVYGGKALVARLHKCDINKDSKLSPEEYAACKRTAHVAIKPEH